MPSSLDRSSTAGKAEATPVRAERGDRPDESGPWVVRTPIDFLDARTTHRIDGEPLSPRLRLLVLILEQFARDRAYLWTSNAELAAIVGCTERNLQLMLAELEAGRIIHRVMTENGPNAKRVGIIFLKRADPDRPVADPECLGDVIARMKARKSTWAEQKRAKKVAPEERRSLFNKDELNKESSSSDLKPDDDDVSGKPGEENGGGWPAALEAVETCFGPERVAELKADRPRIGRMIKGRWALYAEAIYRAKYKGKALDDPLAYAAKTTNGFASDGIPSTHAQFKADFLGKAKAAAAPGAPTLSSLHGHCWDDASDAELLGRVKQAGWRMSDGPAGDCPVVPVHPTQIGRPVGQVFPRAVLDRLKIFISGDDHAK